METKFNEIALFSLNLQLYPPDVCIHNWYNRFLTSCTFFEIIFQTPGCQRELNCTTADVSDTADEDDETLLEKSTAKDALASVKIISRWLESEKNCNPKSLHELTKIRAVIRVALQNDKKMSLKNS